MGGSEKVGKVTYFTDEEYRILLSALNRERKVCEKVDEDCGHEHKLMRIMDSIDRKIKEIQYKRVEQDGG